MTQDKIYVGNLPYRTTSDDLRDLFKDCGGIKEVKVIEDRETGRSKGFAFVTFESEEAATAAVELNGSDLDGRAVKVSFAKADGGGAGGAGGRGGDRNRRW